MTELDQIEVLVVVKLFVIIDIHRQPGYIQYKLQTTDFKSLRVNCCKINEVTSQYKMDFLDRTCKKGSRTEK